MSVNLPIQYSRLNKQPLTDQERFENLALAKQYANTGASYAGQQIAVLNSNGIYEIYIIQPDNSLTSINTGESITEVNWSDIIDKPNSTPSQIDASVTLLQGAISNVQEQIDQLIGVYGSVSVVDKMSDLLSITSPTSKDIAFVKEDETQNNETTMYVYESNWIFIGVIAIDIRNFSTSPIDLESEVAGILPIDKVDTSSLTVPVEWSDIEGDPTDNNDLISYVNEISDSKVIDHNISQLAHNDMRTIISSLQATSLNVQDQISQLTNMYDMIMVVDNANDLSIMAIPTSKTLVFVKNDETHDNHTTIYIHEDEWVLIGIITTSIRDFNINPINLETEVVGILPIDKIDTSSLVTSVEWDNIEGDPADNADLVSLIESQIPGNGLNNQVLTKKDTGVSWENQVDTVPYDDEDVSVEFDFTSYYLKSEVDNLLDQKADKESSFTKSEVDNLLDLKTDKESSFTKSEINIFVDGLNDSIANLQNLKADKETIYLRTEIDVFNADFDSQISDINDSYQDIRDDINLLKQEILGIEESQLSALNILGV